MKKIFVLFFVLSILLTNGFSDDKTDYTAARQIQDINSRIQAYEKYLSNYSDSEFHKYVYVLLAGDYAGINQAKAFEYAEKAEKLISQLDLSEAEMAGLYLILSVDYFVKKDKDKAIYYADKVIQVAGSKQGEPWGKLSSSAQKIKNGAGGAPVEVSPIQRATELYKSGRADEALRIFKDEYKLKKDGPVAYNIGIILAQKAKTDKSLAAEAVNYLLEASILYPKKSQEAMNLAENLFYNHYIDKDTKLSYNALIQQTDKERSALEKKAAEFNAKYGGKEVEEADKKQADSDQQALETMKKSIAQLEARLGKAVEEFNKVLEQARGRVI